MDCSENEAPRNFRVSSTESEAHYTKCLLCYTVKRNFFCPECIRAGNFMHSSFPYSDKFSDKQGKLHRIKANRQHVLDRCEKLLAPKLKKDTLLTETKLARDKIDLLRLAIEQRRNSIKEKQAKVTELINYNNELRLKLPRYQKRVSSLEKHAQLQQMELQNKVCLYGDQAQSLAALRRSRIRQLIKYIFPVYMTYDTSDSIEDIEFLGDEEEFPKKSQLHIVNPWINADGDLSDGETMVSDSKLSESPPVRGVLRSAAALGLAAQLVALLAHTLDVRLPYAINLSEYFTYRSWSLSSCRARAGGCAGALCLRGGLPPPHAPRGGLAALHDLAHAAAADDPRLGRVEAWSPGWVRAAWGAWGAAQGDDDAEPEHLTWPEAQPVPLEEPRFTPPGPAASLVTSAAASIAGLLKGWTK